MENATGILIFSFVYREQACMLSLQLKIPIVETIKSNGIYIVFGAVLMSKTLLKFALTTPVKYVIVNGENVHSNFYDKNDLEYGKHYIFLQKHYPVLQYSPYTAELVEKKYGIKCAGIIDFPFMQRQNRYGLPTKLNVLLDNFKFSGWYREPYDIDLLFYGFPNPNREAVEVILKTKYPNKNILFLYKVYNDDLIQYLIRSKYVLNIPYYDQSALEIHRINQALACGCKVFSKKSSCTYLNEKYKDKVIFVENYEDIVL